MRVTERVWLHGADSLVVNISQTPGVILEYEVQGNTVGSGKLSENRLISVVTIEVRKIVVWRDYMESLASMSVRSFVSQFWVAPANESQTVTL